MSAQLIKACGTLACLFLVGGGARIYASVWAKGGGGAQNHGMWGTGAWESLGESLEAFWPWCAARNRSV